MSGGSNISLVGKVREMWPIVEANNNGKVAAIDIQTAEYEVGEAAYRDMAADETREAEALEWAESTVADVAATAR